MKYKLLGIFNLLFGVCIGFFTFKTLQQDVREFFVFLPNSILIISSITNFFIAYIFFSRKKMLPFYILAIATFVPLLWAALLFVGFFFATDITFLIFSIILSTLVFSYFHRGSAKLAIFLSFITLLASFTAIISSFEEDYCTKKGQEAEKAGTKIVTATYDDAAQLKSYDVKEGATIGANFRAHMICHKSFNFGKAAKDSFFNFK